MGDCSRSGILETAIGLSCLLTAALIVVLWNGIGLDYNNNNNNATSIDGKNVVDRLPKVDEIRIPEERRLRPVLTEQAVEEDETPDAEEEDRWSHWKSDILPNNGSRGRTERVVLAKANENYFEDPLEDTSSLEERHDSGHFRQSQSKVWDPHPQYEFVAFGRHFHLRLNQDSSFVPKGVTVTYITQNATKLERPDHQLGCFYSGYLLGDTASAVAVSLCHGMTGHLRTSTGDYLIRPEERWPGSEQSLQVGSPLRHVIHRLPVVVKVNDRSSGERTANDLPLQEEEDDSRNEDSIVATVRECALEDEATGEDKQEQQQAQPREMKKDDTVSTEANGRRRRRHVASEDFRSEDELRTQEQQLKAHTEAIRSRRAVQPREYFIEIMVVADRKMIDYHGGSLTSYILVLMNTVSRIYKDPSIGNPISIAVVKIKQVEEMFGVRHRGSDGIGAAEMLSKFCHWQKLNNPHEPSQEHHDAALLLTRENLCHNPGQDRCDTLGLAELGRMCSIGSSCAIVQDNGLATAFTIAHEIGHVLNMPHDDDPKCSRFRDRSGVHNIMSRMLDDNTVPWEWSKCSRHYVTDFLEGGQGRCLLDEPREGHMMSSSNLANRLPGEDYSENRQCELVYGPESQICPHMVSDVCKRLWCTVPYWGDRSEQCHTQHMPWADGTRCGPGKWCHRGECVSRESLRPIDGQWSDWGPYGDCSRTCGGGVRFKSRECDNPAPKHGGHYCLGERVRYRSCATKDCPTGTLDFREEQCAAYDNDNRNIRDLAGDVKWHAKYARIVPEERCKLYCQVAGNQYYMLRDKVVDGTPCGPDTFDMCVNGQCRPAGCDRVLNSTARLDVCGVCDGDGTTCRRITGSYNVSAYGYSRVVVVPAGSSNLDVRQRGWNGSRNDSNYLVLRLEEEGGGAYILNGNFMVMSRKVIVHPGVTVEYSGPEQVVERLNSSRPTRVGLVVEVLSVGSVNPPQITWEYTVPLVPKTADRTSTSSEQDKLYAWVVREWTFCDRICQGTMHKRVACQQVLAAGAGQIVADGHCLAEQRPKEERRACNEDCELRWHEVSRSECSEHCGPGSQTVRHRCAQLPVGRHRRETEPIRFVPTYMCHHLEHPPERRACSGTCESAHWRYGLWSPCSVSCGDNGVQIRQAECVDAEDRKLSQDKCSGEVRIDRQGCGGKTCPKWAYGDWNQCSVTCGVGKRERPYWCRIDNRVIHPSLCKGAPLGTSEPCDAGPCPTWHTGDWSLCSVKCGEGVRKRLVLCKYSNETESKLCENATKPISIISCSLEACPTKPTVVHPVTYPSKLPVDDLAQHENDIDSHRITFRPGYSWKVEGFEECSKPCGGGIATQLIQCISLESGRNAPNQGYCDSKTRPAETIACNEHRCPQWVTGNWSACDVKCGVGYQHRHILCQDLRGEVLNDNDCSENTRPRHARKCSKPACAAKPRGATGKEVHKWRAAPWGECSASCGNGYRRREVTCHRVNALGWLDPTPSATNCPEHGRPISEQPCRNRGCSDKYYWTPDSWSKCSEHCGRKGRQVRRLFCLDRRGAKVRRRLCPAESRPRRKRKCNQRPCTGPTSCLEVQSRLKTNVDGEYILFVGGRYMSLYCHGMTGNEPLEYLTLPTGERENYAEIYDKRLSDPHTCPHNGRRNDSCACMKDFVSISGRTMFRKIRLNVHTLRVVENDYRFTVRIGANNIEYGKAGDCYSKVDCPQGRFGINLSGTLLTLSPDVSWPKQKNAYSIINRMNEQRVFGKCGGYCGLCAPSPGIKLNVLPT